MDRQLAPDWFSKPADSIRLLMQRRGITVAELARSLENGIDTFRAIYDGTRAIDEKIARILSNQLGGSSDFWLSRQKHFETALDRVVDVARQESDAWLNLVPSPNGRRPAKKLSEERLRQELRQRLIFFGVSKLDAWERRYGSALGATRFRTSKSYTSSVDSLLLWLRRGEIEAELTSTRPWNPENLRDRIDELRKLTTISSPRRFLPKLRSLLAAAGVALVVVKAPPGCRASGAARMVSPDKAMLLMSFRHRADDQFWFTLFHEIGHLLLHHGTTCVDGDDLPTSQQIETEANDFASFCLIPIHRTEELEELPPSSSSVIRFSVSVGISPGITVGQMQYRKIIGYDRLNHLKRRWSWEDIEPALV